MTPDLCDADLHCGQAVINAVDPGAQAVDPRVHVVDPRVDVPDPQVDVPDPGVDVRAGGGRGRDDHGTEPDPNREHRADEGDGPTVEP